MKSSHIIAALLISGLSLSGCAGQSKTVNQPIGISGNINGLQGSPCNCGGVLPKKAIKAQQKALKAQDKARAKAEKDTR